MKDTAKKIVESGQFQSGIMILILLNSLTLAIETFPMSLEEQRAMSIFNLLCISVFVVEIALKIYVYGKNFFRDGWNIFDFIIVVLSLLPEVAFLSSARVFRIFRIFKAFRATRLIGHMKRLRTLVKVMLDSLPSLGWTICILGILYYIYSIIGTSLYREVSPEYFGNLWESMYTLFQITMADDIGTITWPIIRTHTSSVLFFTSFIVIAVMLILNIIIGIIVDSIEEANRAEAKAILLSSANSLDVELEKLDEQFNLVKMLIEEKKKAEREGVWQAETVQADASNRESAGNEGLLARRAGAVKAERRR